MKKPFVIGIAGGTCSGKSTLSEHLNEALSKKYKVCLINMDRYFKRPGITTIAPITGIEYVEHNHPDALRLDDMYVDFDAAVAPADDAADVVIIEGLFALYLEHIRKQLDLKIFVDLASDERLVRRIDKFMARGQTKQEVTDRYIDTVRFRHNELIEPTRWHADLVINGVFDRTKAEAIVLNYVESQIQ
ncbi:MAG: hypothetical protein J6P31_03645 [Oscillospiraceae bacterium]|nr:hypothetical protein [Oscillospiraceae bacterium]